MPAPEKMPGLPCIYRRDTSRHHRDVFPGDTACAYPKCAESFALRAYAAFLAVEDLVEHAAYRPGPVQPDVGQIRPFALSEGEVRDGRLKCLERGWRRVRQKGE